MKLKELAISIGESAPYVITMQQKFKLPVDREYPAGYAVLLQKIRYLSLASISQKDINALLTHERKLLILLKADSVTPGLLWFESLCTMKQGTSRLLLSGYDMGSSLNSSTVQPGLDFTRREQELFSGREMGDDVFRAIATYLGVRETILSHLQRKRPILSRALKWVTAISH
ncbi:MAG: hypothetical protein PHP44_07815 [Kiritimatiellae bacterium]|nr:hypothetical protein [Kiritimatiellia bacterium]MDD4735997.1 hypothetical protein [Kiritimatiellia bacterium]